MLIWSDKEKQQNHNQITEETNVFLQPIFMLDGGETLNGRKGQNYSATN